MGEIVKMDLLEAILAPTSVQRVVKVAPAFALLLGSQL
jgi:hypothetical protein